MTAATALLPWHDLQRVVGREARRDVTAHELLQRAAVIAPALPAAIAGRWLALAFDSDRLSFLAALLAAWHEGHAVLIVEDTRRERIAPALQLPETALLLHDTGAGRRLRVPPLFDGVDLAGVTPLVTTAIERRLGTAPAPALAVQLVDAQGRATLRSWSGPALLAAIDALGEHLLLGDGQRLLHTCTTGFLPALFAGSLLPLRRGAIVDLVAGRDAAALAAASHEPDVAALLCDVRSLRAMALGGEATRPRPGVALWTTAPIPPAWHSPQLDAAQLTLPPALEPTAAATPVAHAAPIDAMRHEVLVHDVDALPLPDRAAVIAAVAGPGASAAIAGAGRTLPDGRELRWVAFERMPRDPNGRLCAADVYLRAGFGRDGRAVVRGLDWQRRVPPDQEPTHQQPTHQQPTHQQPTHQQPRDQQPAPAQQPAEQAPAAPSVAVLQTTLPPDYLFFDGHFTGYPVLAGAVQLQELVAKCLGALCGELPPLELIDGLKFLQRIAPGDRIELRLVRSDDGRKVTFEVLRDGARCTAGRAVFGAPLPAFQP